MTGAEIIIGVIIAVLFELWSNTEGTPHEDLSSMAVQSNLGAMTVATLR